MVHLRGQRSKPVDLAVLMLDGGQCLVGEICIGDRIEGPSDLSEVLAWLLLGDSWRLLPVGPSAARDPCQFEWRRWPSSGSDWSVEAEADSAAALLEAGVLEVESLALLLLPLALD